MNHNYSVIARKCLSKLLTLTLILNIFSPLAIHAGEPPSDQQSEEQTYSRTGAAQLRFQAGEVNIQEAQAPIAEEPPVFTCDTESPTSYHYEVCCGFCGEYEYCGTRSCPTCADYGMTGTFPDCQLPNTDDGGGVGNHCYSCGCPGKPACKVPTQCHNIDTIVTGNFSKVGNQKESFNGIFFDESQPISESNPLIIFRRQVKIKETPAKWEAIKLYQNPNNPSKLVAQTGELQDFLSSEEIDQALTQNQDQEKYDKWKDQCLVKTYELPEGMTPEELKDLIEEGSAEEDFGENGTTPSLLNIEAGPGKNYGVTQEDMIIDGVLIPAGSIIVGFAKPGSGDFNSPDRLREFTKFKFYHPEHNTLIHSFSSQDVANRSWTVDENGNRGSRIKFGELNDFDKGNPYLNFQYDDNGNQALSVDLDNESSVSEEDGLSVAKGVFNFEAILNNIKRMGGSKKKNHKFAKKQGRKSQDLFMEWFGLDRDSVDIDYSDPAVANKIRALLGLPLSHHDAAQKEKEDAMLLASLQFAEVADNRKTYMNEFVQGRLDDLRKTKRYENATPKQQAAMRKRAIEQAKKDAQKDIVRYRESDHADKTKEGLKDAKSALQEATQGYVKEKQGQKNSKKPKKGKPKPKAKPKPKPKAKAKAKPKPKPKAKAKAKPKKAVKKAKRRGKKRGR